MRKTLILLAVVIASYLIVEPGRWLLVLGAIGLGILLALVQVVSVPYFKGLFGIGRTDKEQ